eukprot:CAMPEP_0176067092 /NCGR_PEP_ID=MMETSP0120_2-20121206/33485_1 /TAXON_ID=160619 /ORGANISM="Kryptoperidinium foliaceum, Strain CCMP 1326" /LENGTH=306 /DNA_ID=CAMNT_0017400703 /DNA_START=112 /DNA_END=1029 /DNA_ORIENTATION=+
MTNKPQIRSRQRRPSKLEVEEYIPPYLRRFVHPYHGDFCVSQFFHPRLMAQLMCEGFLPIAAPEVLLPKLHAHRCVIDLPRGDLHVSKSTRKKAKRFRLTINQAFDRVVEGCHVQHGEKCWLYTPLVEVFRVMNQEEATRAVILNEKPQECPVRLYSIEIWNIETGNLAGGELGYTVGSIYTSLTGFTCEDSAGSVQLAALGRLLMKLGFSLWDLGMEMDYKTSMGCHLMARKEFVAHVKAVRHSKGHLKLPSESTMDAKETIDAGVLPNDVAAEANAPRESPQRTHSFPKNQERTKRLRCGSHTF